MNSSIKPPTTESRKFKFDMDFDAEEERQRVEAEAREAATVRAARVAEETSKLVTYTEAEMTREKEAAYQKGLVEGEAKERQSIEQFIAKILEMVSGQLGGMIEKDAAREKMAQEAALSATMAAIKKVWPQIVQNLGQGLVEDTIRQSLAVNPEETRVVVRVHDSMLDAVVDRLPAIRETEAFAGKVIVLADDSVAAGDCKVEWADGGLERLSRTLVQQLDDAMTRVLSRMMAIQPKDKTSDIERMSS